MFGSVNKTYDIKILESKEKVSINQQEQLKTAVIV